jgi:peptidoglycan lytic transglycosylase C
MKFKIAKNLITTLLVSIMILASFGTTSLVAQEEDIWDDFDDFIKEESEDFDRAKDSMIIAFDEYVAEENRKFDAFLENVLRLWDDTVYSTPSDYVEYSDSFHSRVHIDFEEGNVEASTIIEAFEEIAMLEQMLEAQERLRKQLRKSLVSPGVDNQYMSDYDTTQWSGQPLLVEQVADEYKNLIIDDEEQDYSFERLDLQVDTIVSGDGKRRIKLSSTYKLVPDHLRKRAKSFLPVVTEFADKFDIDIRLVMAIIHTESYFNPKATSQIPAYGLMQIVPQSGGKDATAHLYGEMQLLTSDYLYNPNNNIEIGCAYLNLLRYKYLKNVMKDQIAYPCMIASYNGGIGTVCKAMTGTKSLKALSDEVKDKKFDSLVRELDRKLPYKETKDYLKRVLDRMSLYDEWAD